MRQASHRHLLWSYELQNLTVLLLLYLLKSQQSVKIRLALL